MEPARDHEWDDRDRRADDPLEEAEQIGRVRAAEGPASELGERASHGDGRDGDREEQDRAEVRLAQTRRTLVLVGARHVARRERDQAPVDPATNPSPSTMAAIDDASDSRHQSVAEAELRTTDHDLEERLDRRGGGEQGDREHRERGPVAIEPGVRADRTAPLDPDVEEPDRHSGRKDRELVTQVVPGLGAEDRTRGTTTAGRSRRSPRR